MENIFKQVTLLYVEDDENIRAAMERILSNRFKELFIATNGLEGIEQYQKHKPDLIITDIKMPKLDGISMAQTIKEINSHVPIIIISAHSESSLLLNAIDIGINGYLTKPLNKVKMLNVLEEHSKIILYEREKKRQKKLLQEVIDLQPSIIFSTTQDKKVPIFANKTFLDFFHYDSNKESTDLYDFLKSMSNVTLAKNDDDSYFGFDAFTHNSDETWIDKIFLHSNEQFKIIVHSKDDTNNYFTVKTKEVFHDTQEEPIIVVAMYPSV